MQICISISFIGYIFTYYPIKLQILSYTIYASMILLSFSLFLNIRKINTTLHRHFNQLSIQILFFLIAIIVELIKFTDTIKKTNDLSYDLVEPWAYMSVNYYYNLLFIAGLFFLITIFSLRYCKLLRTKKRFFLIIIGLNFNLIMVSVFHYSVLCFIKYLF